MVGVVFFRFGTFYHLDGALGESELHALAGDMENTTICVTPEDYTRGEKS